MIRRLLLGIVRQIVPVSEREGLLGDLDEEHARLCTTRSRSRATLWLVIEVGSIVGVAIRESVATARSGGRTTWRDRAQEIRYAARRLWRAPGFTLLAVATLAIAIGANTAIFSLLYDVLLRPLPVAHPEHVVSVERVTRDGAEEAFSSVEYRAIRSAAAAAEFAAATDADHVLVATDTSRLYVTADFVAGNYFSMLGIRPALGRVLTEQDEASARQVVVVSERFWERELAGDPSVIGRWLTLRGVPFTVVGVVPAAFHGLAYPGWFTIAAPISTARIVGLPVPVDDRTPWLTIAGRVHAANAPAESAVNAAIRSCCPAGDDARIRLTSIPRGIGGGKDDVRGEVEPLLRSLMGAVALVLLAACANVASLLVSRGAGRARETALRLSLGATRGRVLQLLLAESVLLALGSGAIGCAIALAGRHALSWALPRNWSSMAEVLRVHVEWPVLAFASTAALATVVLAGLVPALRVTGVDLVDVIKRGPGPGASDRFNLERAGVVVQVALSLMLVTGAVLLVTTARRLSSVDSGIVPGGVVVASVETRGTPLERDGIMPIYAGIMREASRVAGVEHAAMSSSLPFFGGRRTRQALTLDGDTPAGSSSGEILVAVTPEFFATNGIAIMSGRAFSDGDRSGSTPVVILSQALALTLGRGENLLGRQVRLAGTPGRVATIVGIAHDTKLNDLRDGSPPVFYRPVAQTSDWPFLELTVRSARPAPEVMREVSAAILRAAPDVRINILSTMDAEVSASTVRERLAAGLATAFGGVALVLAALGIYGLMAQDVIRRAREFGVRSALGARGVNLLALVLRTSFVPLLIGVGIGGPLAAAAGHAVRAELFGVRPLEPLVLAMCTVAILFVGAAAVALPAIRAAKADPIACLKAD